MSCSNFAIALAITACLLIIPSSRADIVYGQTPRNPQVLTGNAGDPALVEYDIDLDGDGQPDLIAHDNVFGGGGPELTANSSLSSGATEAFVEGPVHGAAAALSAGTIIGPASTFGTTGAGAELYGIDIISDPISGRQTSTTMGTGQWVDGQRHFAGFRFVTAGQPHYGWLELSATSTPQITLNVWDWAWETSPDTPIAAGAVPEPAALATLCVATALLLRRRR